LIKNNSDVDDQDNEGMTPLMAAVVESNYDVLNLLLEKNAQVNKINSARETALILAAKAGFIKGMALLISKNADLNVVDSQGKRFFEYLNDDLKNLSVAMMSRKNK
jgi:ankyrin repeat protein